MSDSSNHQQPDPREALRESAEAFGRNLRQWRRLQGWAQDTPMEWGRSAGFAPVYSSQWSNLETATLQNPGPFLFVCLGQMNQRIAAKQWGVIRSRKLRDRVVGAEPICLPDGTPWDAADFFGAYVGQLQWPPLAPVPVTTAAARAWSHQLRQWLKGSAEEAGVGPLAAAAGTIEHAPADQQDRLQSVLMGFSDYEPEEIQGLVDDDTITPQRWLTAWREAMGLTTPLAATGNPWGESDS